MGGVLVTTQLAEVIIPSFSVWFSFEKVNLIEQRALPEFFNNKNKSKTPQVYKDYRDFMIHSYRLNPHEYLSVTACRRNLMGDVCAIIRVHSVLEQWGLINYQSEQGAKPALIGPPIKGHFRLAVSEKLPSKADSNLVFQSNEMSVDKGEKRIIEDTNEKIKRQKMGCTTCGAHASYHSTRRVEINVCKVCYDEGRFSNELCSGDFVKLAKNDGWGDSETLLLLEAIEKYENDWERIEEMVGKPREECITRFLRVFLVLFRCLSGKRLYSPLMVHHSTQDYHLAMVLDD